MSDADAAIRARRAESNAAIAARATDRVLAVMLPDVTVVVAGGPTLVGTDASRAAFAAQFRDTAFRGYVRTPAAITLHATPGHATEVGTWVGTWQHGIRSEVLRGTYRAEWRLMDAGWFVASEVYR